MGFSVGCTELVFLAKLILQILAVLGILRGITSFLLRSFSFSNFLEQDIQYFEDSDNPYYPYYPAQMPEFEADAVLIREMLLVTKFSELAVEEVVAPESSCTVCLNEFDGDDEIRWLTNCRHVFHKECLDRWLGYDQKTCPLCRSPFIPHHLQEAFNESLWAASGIPEFYPESDSELLL